jgi:hypothetical protein
VGTPVFVGVKDGRRDRLGERTRLRSVALWRASFSLVLSQFKGLGKKPIDEQVKVRRLARRGGSIESSFRAKRGADFFSRSSS